MTSYEDINELSHLVFIIFCRDMILNDRRHVLLKKKSRHVALQKKNPQSSLRAAKNLIFHIYTLMIRQHPNNQTGFSSETATVFFFFFEISLGIQ